MGHLTLTTYRTRRSPSEISLLYNTTFLCVFLNADTLYDTITQLLDHQIPVNTKTCRRRPSNAWFDDDCLPAKRLLCSTERVARRAGPLSDLASPTVQAWHNQRQQYFNLLCQKKSCFGRLVLLLISRIRVNCGSHLINCLVVVAHLQLTSMHLTCTKPSATRSLLSSLFSATAGAREPAFTAAPAGCELRVFRPVTQADVMQMIRALPDKQCSSDPLPTWLLKTNVNLLAPFLCHLFCQE